MGLRRFLRQLRFGTDLPYRLYDRLATLHRAFARRQPLRRPVDDELPTPFFIVGSGRSGNTLLRAILTGHDDIGIPPESYVLGTAVREYRKLGYLMWPALVDTVLELFASHPQFHTWETDLGPVRSQLVGCPQEHRSLARIIDAIYRGWTAEHMPSARRWGDKTPTNVYHLPRIGAVFPDALYLHVLRDGRDVVASYVDAGFYDTAEMACRRWVESVELVRDFSRGLDPGRFLEVRYEHLVRDTEAVVRDVCRLLGMSYEPGMLRHRERVDDLGDTSADHHEGLDRPVDDRSVGSWRDRLEQRQRSVVERRLTPLLSSLGYLD